MTTTTVTAETLHARLAQLTVARAQGLDVSWKGPTWRATAAAAMAHGAADELAALLRPDDLQQLQPLAGTGAWDVVATVVARTPAAWTVPAVRARGVARALGPRLGVDTAWVLAHEDHLTSRQLGELLETVPDLGAHLDAVTALACTRLAVRHSKDLEPWTALLDRPDLGSARRTQLAQTLLAGGVPLGHRAAGWHAALASHPDTDAATCTALCGLAPAAWQRVTFDTARWAAYVPLLDPARTHARLLLGALEAPGVDGAACVWLLTAPELALTARDLGPEALCHALLRRPEPDPTALQAALAVPATAPRSTLDLLAARYALSVTPRSGP